MGLDSAATAMVTAEVATVLTKAVEATVGAGGAAVLAMADRTEAKLAVEEGREADVWDQSLARGVVVAARQGVWGWQAAVPQAAGCGSNPRTSTRRGATARSTGCRASQGRSP